jgi:hypothetical protein
MLVISVFLLLYACSITSNLEDKNALEKSFIILKNNDTIYGKKIRFSRGFNKIGDIKVMKVDREKLVYEYDAVYQVHQYRKNGSFYVEELVMLTPENPVSYTLMDIVINTGKVKLYEHNPTRMPNIPFVVSDFFHGYVRNQTEFKNLLNELDKCEAFREKFSTTKERQRKHIEKLLTFYNEFCGGL